MQVGFVILSNGSRDQLQRLISALNREYGRPPIACHHDFGQSPFAKEGFEENVFFVEPYVNTGWAKWSLVQATLEAISLLYSKAEPEWFVLLSAADYPIMRGSEVKRMMFESDCDAFLDARPLDAANASCIVKGSQNPKLNHFNSADNRRIKRRFYKSREFWLPIIRLRPRLRLGRVTYRPPWEASHPYIDWPCFYGDFWFCGNAKVAEILMHPTNKHLELRKHLSRRTQTDETYFSTVLLNEVSLTICLDNKRFAEWNGGGAHPMFLEELQVSEMIASGAFFARKFRLGAASLDKVDAVLAGKGRE